MNTGGTGADDSEARIAFVAHSRSVSLAHQIVQLVGGTVSKGRDARLGA